MHMEGNGFQPSSLPRLLVCQFTFIAFVLGYAYGMKKLSSAALLLMALSACSPVLQQKPTEIRTTPTKMAESPTPLVESTSSPVRRNRRVDDPNEYRFPQMLPYDAIMPVYEPEFAPAQDAPLIEEELVIGVSIDGEAKAYPISVLRVREMVDDELAGIPILVTW